MKYRFKQVFKQNLSFQPVRFFEVSIACRASELSGRRHAQKFDRDVAGAAAAVGMRG
jgi:hypothetical protein